MHAIDSGLLDTELFESVEFYSEDGLDMIFICDTGKDSGLHIHCLGLLGHKDSAHMFTRKQSSSSHYGST